MASKGKGALSRRGFLKASISAAASLAAGAMASPDAGGAEAPTGPGPRAAGGRPNVIYIVTDDGGKEFSCYGAAYKTPNVDAIAAKGVRFTHAYVAAMACSPSRACFYTGQYSHTNGVIGLTNRGWSLPEGAPTIVDYLNQAGYDTVHIGKMHEVRHSGPGNPHGYKHALSNRSSKNPEQCQTRADRVVAAAKKYISGRAAGAPPFFMYLGTKETHSPNRWPMYKPFTPKPEDVKLPGFLPDSMVVKRPFAQFLGAQGFLDEQIGDLLAFLDETGLAGNTLVIFTTDHGISMRRAKGTVYEAGMGVALAMRWPGVIKPGTVRPELTNNIDLMPTILEAAGAAIPKHIHGRSLLGLLTGGKYTPHEYVFTERNFHTNFKPHRAVRDKRHKLILNFSTGPDRPKVSELNDLKDWKDFAFRHPDRPTPFEELYDLKADPHETTNLAGKKELADVQARLRKAIYQWMAETGDFMRGAKKQVFFPEEEGKLLGK